MKTAKRMIALLLVLATATALLVLPAYAAEAEIENTPRVAVAQCPYCINGAMRFVYHHDPVPGDLVTYDLYECDTCHRTMRANVSYG